MQLEALLQLLPDTIQEHDQDIPLPGQPKFVSKGLQEPCVERQTALPPLSLFFVHVKELKEKTFDSTFQLSFKDQL